MRVVDLPGRPRRGPPRCAGLRRCATCSGTSSPSRGRIAHIAAGGQPFDVPVAGDGHRRTTGGRRLGQAGRARARRGARRRRRARGHHRTTRPGSCPARQAALRLRHRGRGPRLGPRRGASAAATSSTTRLAALLGPVQAVPARPTPAAARSPSPRSSRWARTRPGYDRLVAWMGRDPTGPPEPDPRLQSRAPSPFRWCRGDPRTGKASRHERSTTPPSAVRSTDSAASSPWADGPGDAVAGGLHEHEERLRSGARPLPGGEGEERVAVEQGVHRVDGPRQPVVAHARRPSGTGPWSGSRRWRRPRWSSPAPALGRRLARVATARSGAACELRRVGPPDVGELAVEPVPHGIQLAGVRVDRRARRS